MGWGQAASLVLAFRVFFGRLRPGIDTVDRMEDLGAKARNHWLGFTALSVPRPGEILGRFWVASGLLLE